MDNDVGDNFQFRIKGDPVYGTPVFELTAGESSCPWELGTLPRDGVALTMDTYNQSGINPLEPAVFRLTLMNTSPSGDTRDYELVDIPATNPDGAVLKINGISFKDLFPYQIGPDQSRQRHPPVHLRLQLQRLRRKRPTRRHRRTCPATTDRLQPVQGRM